MGEENEIMKIGVVKEIKVGEHRVGVIPAFVSSLVAQGHEVFVERNAGVGSGFCNEEYLRAGAIVVEGADEVWQSSELIVKVKEPLSSEYQHIRSEQILFTYLHLAPNVELTKALIKSGAICIAYETVTDKYGGLPLLAPMSTLAGRMSMFIATNLLQKHFGGSGILPCGVPGVLPGKVLILGGGNVGTNAALIASGIGADVTVFDNCPKVLNRISSMFDGHVKTCYSTQDNVARHIAEADIVIGAALIAGASTPKLISRDMMKTMKPGSVMVDVAIDQGGCFETSHPTTHEDPFYEVEGVIHYCVGNMPGAYARTATISLNNATYPFIEKLANLGYKQAFASDIHLRNGLNICAGNIVNEAVATSQGVSAIPLEK